MELNRLHQLNQEIESRIRETEKKNSGFLTGLIYSIDSHFFVQQQKETADIKSDPFMKNKCTY